MIFFQSIRMAMTSVIGNKIRSFLTMLGIIIGVSSVILVVSVGRNFTNQITGQFDGLGTNQLMVSIMGMGVTSSLTYEEVDAFSKLQGVDLVSPTISGSATAKSGNRHTDASLEGVTPNYRPLKNYQLRAGRFLLDMDSQYRQQVAVLGSEIASKLYGAGNPVGQDVRLNGIPFKVVGVLQPKGSDLSGSNDDKVLIPIATAERFLQTKGIQSFVVKAVNRQDVPAVKTQLEAGLNQKFKNHPEAYNVFDAQEMIESSEKTSAMMSTALASIAGISLIVGGIGIMNIMIMSVNERTREIGIRKALGAKKSNILMQFMFESIVLSSFGGLIGIGAGIGLTSLASKLLGNPIDYAWDIVLISFLFSFFIGLVFGISPAYKASRLRPIHALRTD